MSTPVFLIKLEDLILPMYTQHFVALHNSIGHQSAGVRLTCRGHSYLQCSSFWYCLWAMFGSKFGCTGPHAKLNCDGNRSSSISLSCHRQGTIGQHICFTPSLIAVGCALQEQFCCVHTVCPASNWPRHAHTLPEMLSLHSGSHYPVHTTLCAPVF